MSINRCLFSSSSCSLSRSQKWHRIFGVWTSSFFSCGIWWVVVFKRDSIYKMVCALQIPPDEFIERKNLCIAVAHFFCSTHSLYWYHYLHISFEFILCSSIHLILFCSIWCVTRRRRQYGMFQSRYCIEPYWLLNIINITTISYEMCTFIFFFVVAAALLSCCAYCVHLHASCVVQSMLFTWTKDTWIYVMHFAIDKAARVHPKQNIRHTRITITGFILVRWPYSVEWCVKQRINKKKHIARNAFDCIDTTIQLFNHFITIEIKQLWR